MDAKVIKKWLVGGLLLLVWLEFLDKPDAKRLRNAMLQSLGIIG